MMKRVAEVHCMDPRSRHHEGCGLKIKTAGGFVGGLKDQMPQLLRNYGIAELRVHQHTDCGAMGLVRSAIKDRTNVDSVTYDRVVEPFVRQLKHQGDESRLSGIAIGIQVNIAERWKSAVLKAISYSVDKTAGKVKGHKVLLLTPPFFSKSEDLVNSVDLNPEHTYIVTLVPGEHHRMAVDPKIAVRYLGINDVRLYKGKNDDAGVIEDFWKATRNGKVELGANVTRLD